MSARVVSPESIPIHLKCKQQFVTNMVNTAGLALSVHKNIKINLRFNLIAPRKAKIVYNFGLSECKRYKTISSILVILG